MGRGKRVRERKRERGKEEEKGGEGGRKKERGSWGGREGERVGRTSQWHGLVKGM